jgi:transcriptional regulator with XRE-family HTH domain
MTFGERLRKIRKEKGIKQGELAGRIGIAQYVLSRYEHNLTVPTLTSIEWLCIALEVTATELLGF